MKKENHKRRTKAERRNVFHSKWNKIHKTWQQQKRRAQMQTCTQHLQLTAWIYRMREKKRSSNDEFR